jgi:TetR/AcrR family transcriptional repressor of nem operon
MRISSEQARKNRDRVVDAAANLFREKGFDSVAVAELMRAAGMTHGGFYNHFDSKDEVEAAACARVFEGALARIGAIAAIEDVDVRRRAFEAYRKRYVSIAARDAAGPACPMVAFAGDMARRPPALRETFAEGLNAYLAAYTLASGRDTGARAAAIREFSTLAGALILARGVAKEAPDLSAEILAAAVESDSMS